MPPQLKTKTNKNKTLQKTCVLVCQGLVLRIFVVMEDFQVLSGQLSHKNRGGRRGNNHFIKMERIENPSIIQKFGPS